MSLDIIDLEEDYYRNANQKSLRQFAAMATRNEFDLSMDSYNWPAPFTLELSVMTETIYSIRKDLKVKYAQPHAKWFLLLIREGTKIVSGLFLIVFPGFIAEVTNVCTDKAQRSKGHFKRLLLACEGLCKTYKAHVMCLIVETVAYGSITLKKRLSIYKEHLHFQDSLLFNGVHFSFPWMKNYNGKAYPFLYREVSNDTKSRAMVLSMAYHMVKDAPNQISRRTYLKSIRLLDKWL